ncbi:MAG: alpha-E domain-containing protein [Chthoniobacteraceae bacterium]
MLSRTAEDIFWMSRYVERAENVARCVDVNLNLMLETPFSQQQWKPIVSTTGDDKLFAKRYGKATQENVIQFLTFEEENPNSIISCLRAARENARSTREITSSEMWEQLNTFYLFVADAARHGARIDSLHAFFTKIKEGSHTFNGITDATMTHGEAWHFLNMGRMMERADKTSRILDVKYFILLPSTEQVGTPVDEIQWAAVLRSASAFEMYRKQTARISPTDIVDFLLFNLDFPRAVRYSLSGARQSLHAISGTPLGQSRTSPERLLGQLCSELAYQSVDEVVNNGLHEFIDQLQTKLNQVGSGIHETFFVRRAPQSTTNGFQNANVQ